MTKDVMDTAPEVLWAVVDHAGEVLDKPRKSELKAKHLIQRLRFHHPELITLRVVRYVKAPQ